MQMNNLSLLSISSPNNNQSKKDDTDVDRNDLESIFLKRLNFLKTLLDEEIKGSNKNSFNFGSMSNNDLFKSGRIIFNTPQNANQDEKKIHNRSFSNTDL